MHRPFLSITVMVVLPFVFSGCRTPSPNGITQVATIDALLTGVYDGHMSLNSLRAYGDFGIGTFEALDGEMILLDGVFYQVRADGKVYRPSLSERTPFACVTRFDTDLLETIPTMTDKPGLEATIDALVPQPNRFCAFRVHGVFSNVQTRSVPAQHKPYLPLAEVTKNQPVFSRTNAWGTLIGFRSPAFVKGITVPGYHMHFLADDRSGGGHVLAFNMDRGNLQADTVHEWLHLYLPTDNEAFGGADLTPDRTQELQTVEKSAKP